MFCTKLIHEDDWTLGYRKWWIHVRILTLSVASGSHLVFSSLLFQDGDQCKWVPAPSHAQRWTRLDGAPLKQDSTVHSSIQQLHMAIWKCRVPSIYIYSYTMLVLAIESLQMLIDPTQQVTTVPISCPPANTTIGSQWTVLWFMVNYSYLTPCFEWITNPPVG